MGTEKEAFFHNAQNATRGDDDDDDDDSWRGEVHLFNSGSKHWYVEFSEIAAKAGDNWRFISTL